MQKITNASVLVIMRMGSSRLPCKPFAKINKYYTIDHIYNNLRNLFSSEDIIFAIPRDISNNALVNYCTYKGYRYFAGSEDNVLERFIETSTISNKDWLIRYNGDNLFYSRKIFEKFSIISQTERYKLITNIRPRSLPKGVTFEAIHRDVLQEVSELPHDDYAKEHIFPAFYDYLDDSLIFNIRNEEDFSTNDFALDTIADVIFFKNLSLNSYNIDQNDIADLSQLKENFRKNNPFIGSNGPLLIAEIGGNHQGDFEYANKLIDLAIDTDVDCIKLQIYSPDLIVNPIVDPDRNQHFSKFSLEESQYKILLSKIRNAGKIAMASIWSIEELRIYRDFIDMIKIGSGDFSDRLILKEISKYGKPLIISSGLTDEDEVKCVINQLLNMDVYKKNLCLLQCTSMYPIPQIEANLNVLYKYRSLFPDISIGYSDHTITNDALLKSVSMGAEVLEFHFTDDKFNRRFRDHCVSLEQSDIHELIKKIRIDYTLGGVKEKQYTASELSSGHIESFKKGLYPKYNLEVGHILKEKDLISLRPDIGYSASRLDEIVGKKLLVAKNKYEPFCPNDF
jgi:N-acetylneuraminate synthase/N,N'-diacetyllegionaminate synthase